MICGVMKLFGKGGYFRERGQREKGLRGSCGFITEADSRQWMMMREYGDSSLTCVVELRHARCTTCRYVGNRIDSGSAEPETERPRTVIIKPSAIYSIRFDPTFMKPRLILTLNNLIPTHEFSISISGSSSTLTYKHHFESTLR